MGMKINTLTRFVLDNIGFAWLVGLIAYTLVFRIF
jgi:hypothetical protein